MVGKKYLLTNWFMSLFLLWWGGDKCPIYITDNDFICEISWWWQATNSNFCRQLKPFITSKYLKFGNDIPGCITSTTQQSLIPLYFSLWLLQMDYGTWSSAFYQYIQCYWLISRLNSIPLCMLGSFTYEILFIWFSSKFSWHGFSYCLYCLAWVVVTDKLLKHIIPSFPCCHIIVLKVWTPTGFDANVNFAKMWNFSFMQDP